MRRALLALTIVCGLSPGARAQDLPRLTPVADGVYVYQHADPTKAGVTANNLVVLTDAGVLVADGQGTVENTHDLLSAIATLTSKPVRFVVIGSIHGDHRGGDAAFPAGTTFVQRDAVDSGTLSMTLGEREIRILFLGRAHTGVDLAVFLPRERVTFLSEIFIDGIFPSMANGFPTEWVAALTRAEQLDAATWISAHGRVGAPLSLGKETVVEYRHAIERVIAEGRRLHDAHVAVDAAFAQANFAEWAGWLRLRENAPGALKRVYQELDGELAPARQAR